MRNYTWRYRYINHDFIKRFILLFLILAFFILANIQSVSKSWANNRRAVKGGGIDFTTLSLEELKQITIVSILKKPQELSETTSAISVISQEDIRRSGARSIPELLRLVPGLYVAQINLNTWAVSVRGFNHRFANKLLVLMDGRSLYTPLFSGVHWGVQDTILEDIKRIEVIRGPGATLWGANAVNGVINIITKEVNETKGGLIGLNWIEEETGYDSHSYCLRLANGDYGRLYAKYSKRKKIPYKSNFFDDTDEWDSLRGGGRFEFNISAKDSITILNDNYTGRDIDVAPKLETQGLFDEFVTDNYSGNNVLCRWKHGFSDTSEMTFQFYYDRTDRVRNYDSRNSYSPEDLNLEFYRFIEQFDTYDFDAHHNFRLGSRQEVVWGFGFRQVKDLFKVLLFGQRVLISDIQQYFDIQYMIPKRRTTSISAFIQDSIDLIEDKLRLEIGSKFEDNDHSDLELQPSLRLSWRPGRIQNVWAAISRALRIPARFEMDFQNPVVKPEELIAYELGYRIRFADSFSVDLAGFYNSYENLISYDSSEKNKNIADGETFGGELGVHYEIMRWWRAKLFYSYIKADIDIHDKLDTDGLKKIQIEASSPKNQITLISSLDFGEKFELDLNLRYVDNMGVYVDSYTELDAHFGWYPFKNIEISISGRNLLNKYHDEFLYIRFPPGPPDEIISIPIERKLYGKIIWRFD